MVYDERSDLPWDASDLEKSALGFSYIWNYISENDLQTAACANGEPWYPRCRGCAEENGHCPYWFGWPCNRDERHLIEEKFREFVRTIVSK